MSRANHGLLPISYDGWDDISDSANQFYNVEFTRDWGPFKVGDKIHTLAIFDDGKIATYDEGGNETNVVSVRLVPVGGARVPDFE